MKNLLFSVLAAVAVTAATAALAQSTAQKYACVMHPEVVMDEPGQCPKCGMTLVPKEEAKRPTSNVQRPMET